MTRPAVDYKNFIKKLGIKGYKTMKIAQKGTPYIYKVGTIDFVTDLNDPYVAGDEITVSFTGKKPAKTLLISVFFDTVEQVSSYTALEVDSIVGQKKNSSSTLGDVNVDIKLSGANAQDWISGKIDVYALLVD